jgi:hypothetical protein
MINTYDTTTLTIIQTIEAVLIGEIGGLIYPEGKGQKDVFVQTSPFIKFLPIICSIEFLGAVYDEHPFDTTRLDNEKIVETRFKKGLKELFPKQYLPFTKESHKNYFYTKLRCAMVHQLKPGKGISFTTRRESFEDGHKHLTENSTGVLILVLEDFYDDLKLAAEKIIRHIKSNKITNKKGEQTFLAIHSVQKP